MAAILARTQYVEYASSGDMKLYHLIIWDWHQNAITMWHQMYNSDIVIQLRNEKYI